MLCGTYRSQQAVLLVSRAPLQQTHGERNDSRCSDQKDAHWARHRAPTARPRRGARARPLQGGQARPRGALPLLTPARMRPLAARRWARAPLGARALWRPSGGAADIRLPHAGARRAPNPRRGFFDRCSRPLVSSSAACARTLQRALTALRGGARHARSPPPPPPPPLLHARARTRTRRGTRVRASCTRTPTSRPSPRPVNARLALRGALQRAGAVRSRRARRGAPSLRLLRGVLGMGGGARA